MSNIVNIKRLDIMSFSSSPKYFYEFIQNIPILTKEEESELIEDMNVKGCLEAAHKLIIHNLRYVHFITHKYSGYGIPYEDLVQEGIIGLMHSIKKFDPTNGVNLITYASHLIEGAIKKYIITNWNMVKITTTHDNKKLFFNLRKYLSNNNHPTKQEIETASLELGVSKDEIVDFAQRMNYGESSLDYTQSYEDSDDYMGPSISDILTDGVTIEDKMAEYDRMKLLDAITESMDALTQKEKEIIEARYMIDDRKTLSELSHTYGVSMERIRQIEVSAIKKIKNNLALCGAV